MCMRPQKRSRRAPKVQEETKRSVSPKNKNKQSFSGKKTVDSVLRDLEKKLAKV